MREVLTAGERRWHARWGHLNDEAASNCEAAGGINVFDKPCRYYEGLLDLRAASPAPDMRMHDLFATALQEGRTVTVFPGDEAAAVAAAWAIGLDSFELRARGSDSDLVAKAKQVIAGHVKSADFPEPCRECGMLWPCHAWLLADDIVRSATHTVSA